MALWLLSTNVHIYEITEKSPQQQLKSNTAISAVITLMRIAHTGSNHHLHHEQQWLAAITLPWTWSAPNSGCRLVYMINCLNVRQTIIEKSVSWTPVTSPKWEDLGHDIGWHSRLQLIEKMVNSILMQNATPAWFITSWQCVGYQYLPSSWQIICSKSWGNNHTKNLSPELLSHFQDVIYRRVATYGHLHTCWV